MNRSLTRLVWERAGGCCEYCRLPQAYSDLPYQIDHVIAEQHGGRTVRANLALACLPDNKRKGPNLSGIDPVTGKLVPLFHPRRQRWGRHFRWRGPYLVGRTQTGRATIRVLAINAPDRVDLRRCLIAEGVFPPP
ncbi:MAG: HNH endonuclease signature motif containing protein [Gemmataceae bacterium]